MKKKRVRAIGVSNFHIHHLETLYVGCEIKPMINQIEFHPRLLQIPLFEFCKQQQIYCTYSLYGIIADNLFQISEIVLWTITGIGLVGVNLIFAHKLAEKFDKRQKYNQKV